jgi:hypothetical protein
LFVCLFSFFFCTNDTNDDTLSKENNIIIWTANLSFSVEFYHFLFVLSRLPSSWRGHISKPANLPWHSRSKVVQDRTPGNLKNACAVISCLLYFLQLKLSYLMRFLTTKMSFVEI